MTLTPTRPGEPRTYGNWQVPKSAGYGNLSWRGWLTAVGFVAAAVCANLFFDFRYALGIAVLGAIVVALMLFPDKHGDTVGTRIHRRLAWRKEKATGAHLYRSGPLSSIPHGAHRLPGIAAQSDLTEHRTSWNQSYALLELPSVGRYIAYYMTEPDGGALVDPGTIDTEVANLGGWLNGCAQEPDLVGASITIQARPDTGERLRAEVELNGGKGSSASRKVMAQAVEQLPRGSSIITAWASTTFAASPLYGGGKRRTTNEMALELSSRVPLIADGLRATGAGAARPATAADLCEVVRTAYQPALAQTFDEMRAAEEVPTLTWDQVGPTAAEAGWDWYRHDGGWSITWYMTLPPRGDVQHNILARLLAPQPGIDLTRTTLLYRPFDIGEAADVVNADLRDASFALNNPTGAKATHEVQLRYERADKTAREEAAGAGVVNFAIVTTATVTDESKLREARAVINGLMRGTRLLAREPYASQATAFLVGVLGIDPSPFVQLPEQMRK